MSDPAERCATTAVDVVVPTRDRPLQLARLLDDLGAQTVLPASVTVVDDSTRPIPAPRSARLPISTVRRASTGRSISAAKNLGWRDGSAPLVAFVDDDNRLPPGLLAGLAADLDEHPGWGAVMPGVLYRRRPDLVWVYAAPFRAGRWAFELIGRNAPRDHRLERSPLPTDALPNLSMIRRSVLRAVGGFDERLPISSSADLCQRIKAAGWEVWADPRWLTEHDVEPPGAPGYWAEHTIADVERHRLETADWLRFHARWNARDTLFPVRAGYHALGFLGPHLLAVGLRSPSAMVRHAAAALSGFRAGRVG